MKNFRENLGGDPEVPHIPIQNYGYMYLADNEELRQRSDVENQKLQIQAWGAGTKIMTPRRDRRGPIHSTTSTALFVASHNLVDEGYFDGNTMFQWWRRKARENGAEYVTNEVVAIGREGNQVTNVTLKSGEVVKAGKIVNCSGPRANRTAGNGRAWRFPSNHAAVTHFIFDAESPLGPRSAANHRPKRCACADRWAVLPGRLSTR